MKLARQILALQYATWIKCVHLVVDILRVQNALSADVLMDMVEKDINVQVSTCNSRPADYLARVSFKTILQILMNVSLILKHVISMLTVVILMAATCVSVRRGSWEMDIIALVRYLTSSMWTNVLNLQCIYVCRY